MPIFVPILLGGVAAVLAGKGIKDSYDGIKKLKKLKEEIESINELYEKEYNETTGVVEDFIERDLSAIGEKKLKALRIRLEAVRILQKVIKKGKIKSVELSFEDIVGDLELEKKELIEGIDAVGGLVKIWGSAGLAYVAATGIATKIGVASTGTPIAALSGAAAKNALLAWFGGGAIAAGGGGKALGTVVLGGIVTAPAILVGGFVLKKHAEKKHTEVEKYKAKVELELKKLKTIRKNIKYAKEYLKIYESVLDRVMELVKERSKKLNHKLRFIWLLGPFKSRFLEKDVQELFLLNKYGLKALLEMDLIDNKKFALKNGVEAAVEEIKFRIERIADGGV